MLELHVKESGLRITFNVELINVVVDCGEHAAIDGILVEETYDHIMEQLEIVRYK